jgi:hypothetical protein
VLRQPPAAGAAPFDGLVADLAQVATRLATAVAD